MMDIKTNLNGLNGFTRLDGETTQAAQKTAQRPESNAAQAVKSPGGDVVELSSTSLKGAVMNAAQSAPDIRQEKVNALRSAVSDGSYQPDSTAIASGLMKAESALFGE